jgi:hypothetical protein
MRFLRAFGSSARMAYHLELEEPIVIRRSGVGDETALTRLAALDSRTLPAGSFLLGEINGEVVAAVPLDARSTTEGSIPRDGQRPRIAPAAGRPRSPFSRPPRE